MNRGLTAVEIVADLRALGLRPGDEVLVHSSLSSLGWVEGGADTVVDALIAAVSPGGTVLAPALTGSPEDGPDRPPRMDVRSTPCASWIGRIPEAFRRRPEARRSLHPTHSVTAIGAQAEWYTTGHEHCTTPCGPGSPYIRLMDRGGYILLLGCTQESNTSLHALEELAGVPYHLQYQITHAIVVDADGRELVVSGRLHLWGWKRNFSRIDEPLRQAGAMREGRVGQAHARLIHAGQMREIILPLIQADPLYLLADEARVAFMKQG
ncbi:MAG: AAC(3) family N-acetyltransferase [Anaerolineae bacterium]|nr:AAC(3) family N-acetyltransferase [Anaerolineae bacterium]MDW8098670.1 AAC(3) family N-acetyltransferase [Anaerolineae bacterium]